MSIKHRHIKFRLMGGVIGVALPCFFEGIDIVEQLFYNVSHRRVKLSKEELKREIVELVDQIDNEKILKLIAGFVKSGYKEEQAGK